MSPYIKLEGNLVVHRDEIVRAEFMTTAHSCYLDIKMRSGSEHRYRDTAARAIWRAIERQSLPSGKDAEEGLLARLCSAMRK